MDEGARSSDLVMSSHHLVVETAAGKLGGRIGHCFRNAYRHLRLSWLLHPIDSEMSAFRAITADEEASTALILALKQQGYPAAAKLSFRKHAHKAGVSPFLDAVTVLLAESGIPTPKLLFSPEGPSIKLSIDIGRFFKRPEPLFAEPDHPFNYSLGTDRGKDRYLFQDELEQIAAARGSQSVLDHIDREANLRNLLLYASNDGIPKIVFEDDFITRRRDRVHRAALLTIGILQTRKRQLFADQCVSAYSQALGNLEQAELEPQVSNARTGWRMDIEEQPDGTYGARSSWQTKATIRVRYSYQEDLRVTYPGDAGMAD